MEQKYHTIYNGIVKERQWYLENVYRVQHGAAK